jgi:hypothetical protein
MRNAQYPHVQHRTMQRTRSIINPIHPSRQHVRTPGCIEVIRSTPDPLSVPNPPDADLKQETLTSRLAGRSSIRRTVPMVNEVKIWSVWRDMS